MHSDSTAGWSTARARLPAGFVRKALKDSAQTIRQTFSNWQWRGFEPILVDGTTVRSRPYGDIKQAFPPHTSGKSSHPYWCLTRAVVAICPATGLALDCAIGSTKDSEQALFARMLSGALWTKTLAVADRNFGVFSVVRAVVQADAGILVRMTGSRARKLAADSNIKLCNGVDHQVLWSPSRHDQCPEESKPIAGRLIAIEMKRPGFRPVTLYLFTTVLDVKISAWDLAQLYGIRWQVELDLRYIKTELKLEVMECKSANMVCKTWLSGLIACNVVRALMCAASATRGQPVAALSFTRTLRAVRAWLPNARAKKAAKAWTQLLTRVAGFTLPKRITPRPSEPRAIRYFKRDFPKLLGNRGQARQKLALLNLNS